MSPVYAFVGGACHTPLFFEEVIKQMSTHNIESIAIALPTIGDTPPKDGQDEFSAIRNAVINILDGGSDVVLVCHSYGGVPGSRAVVGLDKEQRLKDGKSNGVVEICFIAAFLLEDGASLLEAIGVADWLTIADGRMLINEKGIPILFNDLDESAQQYWLSQFKWQSFDPLLQKDPGGPWHLSIPKTYIITTCDKGSTLEWHYGMLRRVINKKPETWTIKSIASGHEPFLSQPARLVRVILQPAA